MGRLKTGIEKQRKHESCEVVESFAQDGLTVISGFVVSHISHGHEVSMSGSEVAGLVVLRCVDCDRASGLLAQVVRHIEAGCCDGAECGSVSH